MFRIKKLYTFVLKAFLPLLLVTFGVCLFILLMQFLWKYVDDMVGKGIDMDILSKMFFYAAISLIPMTLPLAILLASLMTFGNLGEHLELLAIKSAGVSLLRIMRPIIITLVFICGISFYFQNNIVPATQSKLWTIVMSMRQKSPELDIPEGIFYKEIDNYNMYVRHKEKKGGLMYDMMIYDFSEGFESATVIVADSGRLNVSEDKLYLVLTLYSGESFENYVNKDRSSRLANEKIPYRRETFSLKEVLIKFDTNFNMADESIMQNRDISKNMKELMLFADSTKLYSNGIDLANKDNFKSRIYQQSFSPETVVDISLIASKQDTVIIGEWDDYLSNKTLDDQKQLADRAKSRIEGIKSDYILETMQQTERLQKIRGHEVEIQKRFSLSLACLIFFFIGGPLGAIIRKGGLGMPAVLSVFLFLFYYTIDIFGVKMAKQGVWPIWQGVWLSTLVLSVLGAFFTYKAVNDSVMMNPEAWKDFFQRFFGKREVRNFQRREVIITSPNYENNFEQMSILDHECNQYLKEHKKWTGYFTFWKNGFKDDELKKIIDREERIIDDMRNSTENLILGKLMDYPIVKCNYPNFLNFTSVRWICVVVVPIGIIVYLTGLYKRKIIREDVKVIASISRVLMNEIKTFVK